MRDLARLAREHAEVREHEARTDHVHQHHTAIELGHKATEHWGGRHEDGRESADRKREPKSVMERKQLRQAGEQKAHTWQEFAQRRKSPHNTSLRRRP